MHRTTRKLHPPAAAFRLLLAIMLGVSLAPLPAQASQSSGMLTSEAFLIAESGFDGTVTGGSEITQSGCYLLAEDARGMISIAEELDVTIVGTSYDEDTESFTGTVYSDLNLVVGDGSKLTLRDAYIELTTKNVPAAVDFAGAGELDIEGVNLIDRPYSTETGNEFPAVIHVGSYSSVTFEGSGMLYGYKQSLGSYIGADANEASGEITFKSGTWLLKGSQTGPVIGSDSANGRKGGDITVDGGSLYVKTVSQGAGIGSSRAASAAPDVIVNGGLVQVLTDFSGSAIGRGGSISAGGDPGTLTVNGGSIMTIVTPNAFGSWGFGDRSASEGSLVTDANITSAHDTAMLRIPTGQDYTSGSVTVNVDGKEFYEGPGSYAFVTNEAKNPSDYEPSTPSNWYPNEKQYLIGADGTATGKSSFAGERALYLMLPKTDHAITVGSTTYQATWNAANGTFTLDKVQSGTGPADYASVDAALAKVPANLSGYTTSTAAALNAAVAAVTRGLGEREQARVDAMAKAIEKALAALKAKAANPLSVTAKGISSTFSTSAVTISTKPLTVSNAKGAVTYAKSSGKSYFTVAKTTGKVTVAKKTPAGTYKVGIKATAAGNGSYKAKSVTKAVNVTVNKSGQTISAKNVTKTFAAKKSGKQRLLAKTQTVNLKTAAKASAKTTLKFSKANTVGGKMITVSSVGKLTLKKGLKAGVYRVKVKLAASQGTNYKAASKTITVTVKAR